jgi:hypothetical protein
MVVLMIVLLLLVAWFVPESGESKSFYEQEREIQGGAHVKLMMALVLAIVVGVYLAGSWLWHALHH